MIQFKGIEDFGTIYYFTKINWNSNGKDQVDFPVKYFYEC